MTHLERVVDHAIRQWERRWTPPPPRTTQPGAVLATRERLTMVGEIAAGLQVNYTLERKDGGGIVPDTMGAAIKAARESKDMTQLQLGAAVGRACSTVCYWESNRHRPNRDDLRNLREVLGTSIPAIGYQYEAL